MFLARSPVTTGPGTVSKVDFESLSPRLKPLQFRHVPVRFKNTEPDLLSPALAGNDQSAHCAVKLEQLAHDLREIASQP